MAKKAKKQKQERQHAISNVGLAITTALAVAGAPPALHNPEVLKSESSPILSNPMDIIDTLTKCNPFWGGVALRVLCNTIGYSAVNTVLWDFRKRNQAPKITSTIDWFNDTMAEKKAKEDSDQNFEDQGHDKLKYVDGNQMIGPYKYLFMLVAQSDDSTMQLPSPAALYDKMRQKDAERDAIKAAYDTFEMEHYANSPNAEYVKARVEKNKKADDERTIRKAKQEIDHIHTELSLVKYEVFDDNVWDRLPLHTQFRIMRSVYNQVCAAITQEMMKASDERIHLEALNDLGEQVLLELEAADRTPEVRLAFEKQVLKDTHALIKRVPVATNTTAV